MSEVQVTEMQCYCGYMNKFREKGEFIQSITGTTFFISHENNNEKICEQCGRRLYFG